MTTIEEIKKIAQHKKAIIGSTEIVRKLKQGTIENIFLASNIPSDVEEEIMHNAEIASVEVEKLTIPNMEFGMAFKRVHPILAIGFMKE